MSDFLAGFGITTPYFGSPQIPYLKISLITDDDVLELYKQVMNCELIPIWLKAAEGYETLEQCLTMNSLSKSKPPPVSSSELAKRIKLECLVENSPLRLRQLLGRNSKDIVASIHKDSSIITHLRSNIGTVYTIVTNHKKYMNASGAVKHLESVNEQQLMCSIATAVMTPVIVHEQCQTKEVNENATVHLPCAKFDMLLNQLCNDKEEHQIAVSFNGKFSLSPDMALSNKTDNTISIRKPSVQIVLETLVYSEIVRKDCIRFLTVSESHVRVLFYLKNCDVLLTTKLLSWHGRDPYVLPGMILLLLALQFGRKGYHNLDSSFLDNTFTQLPQYKCNWREAYSNISHDNSYSHELLQTKPSNVHNSQKLYHTSTRDDDVTDEGLLSQLDSKRRKKD